MWPLHILFNRFLQVDGQYFGRSVGVHSSSVDTYPFQHSNRINPDSVMPHSHFVEVPHIGIDLCDTRALTELCSTTSIWTVDVAHLLKKFSVGFSFLTVTVGANPEFSVETYYKEQLPNDLMRVDRLFQEALECGINIQDRSISGEELSVLVLSGNYIAIALVGPIQAEVIT